MRSWLFSQLTAIALSAAEAPVHMGTTTNGIRFGWIGAKPKAPAPTVFFLGGAVEDIVTAPQYSETIKSCNQIIGAFFGPLFGIFVLGMFSRNTRPIGVMIGAMAGLASSCFASYFSEVPWLQSVCGRWFGPEFIHFFKQLSWQWPAPLGVTMTLLIGYLASRLIPSSHSRATALTFREVMKRPPLDKKESVAHD